MRLREAPGDLAGLLAPYERRRLVLVVRDAARHAWQEETVAAATKLRPDAIVVETGIPAAARRRGVDRHPRRGARELAAAAEALSG